RNLSAAAPRRRVCPRGQPSRRVAAALLVRRDDPPADRLRGAEPLRRDVSALAVSLDALLRAGVAGLPARAAQRALHGADARRGGRLARASERCGAAPRAERGLRHRAAGGAGPRRRPRPGADRLTARGPERGGGKKRALQRELRERPSGGVDHLSFSRASAIAFSSCASSASDSSRADMSISAFIVPIGEPSKNVSTSLRSAA